MNSKLLIFVFLLVGRMAFSQSVDFTHMFLSVNPDTLNQEINGRVLLAFTPKGQVDSIYLNGVRMTYHEVLLNAEEVEYAYDEQGIWLLPKEDLPDSSWVSITYSCKPRKGIYFIGWQDTTHRSQRQIWTQGQGIDHRHWIPHNDDQIDKLIVNLSVEFADTYQVMANGVAQGKLNRESGISIRSFSMKKPMSSYLIGLAIGKYDTSLTHSSHGVKLTQYYYPHRANDYQWYYSKNEEIFNFMQSKVGVDYPWQNYKQAPVQDFRHGAMENTTATIFGDFFMVDSIAFNDENYSYVNAHELAHQWFGNLVTATGSDEHWLHEGFATYYQWLSEQHLYGFDKADWDRYKAAVQVWEASKNDSIPLGNGKAGSARFYQKGAWVLHMLNQELGDSLFDASIEHYLNAYAFGLVTTDSLNASLKSVSGKDFSNFFERWIDTPGEPILEIESHRENKQVKFTVTNIYRPAPDLPLLIPVMLQQEGGAIIEYLEIGAEDAVYYLDLADEPSNYWVINPDRRLLVNISERRETKEWMNMYPALVNLLDRHQVLLSLQNNSTKETTNFLRSVASDPAGYYALRIEALSQLISSDDKKARSILTEALKENDIQLQKELVSLIPRNWKEDMRDDLLPLLRSGSYDLRVNAVHLCVDVNNPKSNLWLNDVNFEREPGIPGHKVLIPILFYRYYLLEDLSARDQLIDLSGPSYNFLTRINSIMALGPVDEVLEAYIQNLFNALFDNNWKLSSTARNELQRLYRSDEARSIIDQIIDANQDIWEDFEKRKVQRTFETN